MTSNAADQSLRARAMKVVPGGMYGHDFHGAGAQGR